MLVVGVLLVASMHLRVAAFTRDHATAAAIIEDRLRAMRAMLAQEWPRDGERLEGTVGACSWSAEVTAEEVSTLRLRFEAHAGRADLMRTATLHAP
ncbi:MAG: hypothetical protein H0U69_10050 [Trueperaceae bacterium]|nr:hypothetical protein [Trueperaceae bacterium]